jgi:hypothetical protein
MSHYAHITNNIVDQVIVAEADFIASLPDPENWIQTSYNTIGGVHVDPVTRKPDGGTPLNKNYAGIGYTWDGAGFASPQPFPSWTLDSNTYRWNAPVSHPSDGGFYKWNEDTKSWDKVVANSTSSVNTP